MSRFVLIFSILLLAVSCSGELEKIKLVNEVSKNKKYGLEIITRKFNQNDSLNFEEKRQLILDSENRLICKNGSSFFFYNHSGQLSQIKSVYRRGGKTNILIYQYIYDKKQNLRFVTYQFSDIDTIKIYAYNRLNQLVREEYPFRKSFIYYKYRNGRVSEITEIENDTVSKHTELFYDRYGNKTTENWIFNGERKMKTYFEFNAKQQLISKRDSSMTTGDNPNECVESLDRYYYNKQDSLAEKRQYDRVLNENDFKYRGKTTYEYKRIQ